LQHICSKTGKQEKKNIYKIEQSAGFAGPEFL